MSMLRRRPTEELPPLPRLRVDPVACDGVGICSHLAPDIVTVDSWGYPIVHEVRDLRALRQAEAAVQGCPRRALFLDAPVPAPAP